MRHEFGVPDNSYSLSPVIGRLILVLLQRNKICLLIKAVFPLWRGPVENRGFGTTLVNYKVGKATVYDIFDFYNKFGLR